MYWSDFEVFKCRVFSLIPTKTLHIHREGTPMHFPLALLAGKRFAENNGLSLGHCRRARIKKLSRWRCWRESFFGLGLV